MKQPPVSIFVIISVALVLLANAGCDCMCSANKGGITVPSPVTAIPVEATESWNFAVSGDSRNCGDVVMPAIAESTHQNKGVFYWHLGDLRATYDFDEDYRQGLIAEKKEPLIANYLGDSDGKNIGEWQDFRKYQVLPFGETPFFLGIGNHETIWPQSRERFAKEFADLFDRRELKDQRLVDLHKHNASQDTGPKTYFHWIVGTVDFIYLDNASKDQLSAAQLAWFENVLKDDREARSKITTVVVGMHAALPNSLSLGHSMNQASDGGKSGLQVYNDLLDLQNNGGKKVYVLASHSHFFMDGTFKTLYWRDHGGQLQGWIIGTAGAFRYVLPDEAKLANAAKTGVYGYLLGTVATDGSINFEFHEFKESDIPPAVVGRYTPKFVHWCFAENKEK